MSDWVETIEKADHKGDTKAKRYSGLKALSGAKRVTSKRPTMRDVKTASTDAEAKGTAKSTQQTRASDTKTVTEPTSVVSANTTNDDESSGVSRAAVTGTDIACQS